VLYLFTKQEKRLYKTVKKWYIRLTEREQEKHKKAQEDKNMKMSKEELRRYYEANIERIRNTMKRTDISEDKKFYLGCTEAAIEDFKRCIAELG
jgi:formylmethanofuran dehydrogenase subunit E